MVRWCRRCASTSLPSFSSCGRHHSSSVRMLVHGALAHLRRQHVVGLGIDRQALIGLLDLPQQRVDLGEILDFVAPQFDAKGEVVVGGIDLDDVAAHAKRAALEIVIVAVVEDVDQARHDLLARDLLAFFEHEQHAVVGFGRAETVDAAHAGDDDDSRAARTGTGWRRGAVYPAHRWWWLLFRCRRRSTECRLRAGSNRNS